MLIQVPENTAVKYVYAPATSLPASLYELCKKGDQARPARRSLGEDGDERGEISLFAVRGVVGDTGNVYAKPESVERRETYQRATITFDLAAYAQLELQLDLTADLNNLELTLIFNLAGAGASLKLNARTILRAQQQLKIITQQNHLAAATTSDVLLKTVCFDQSQWAYDGKIFVAAAGHQTVASQLNHNLLVSTISAPMRPNFVASGCAAPVVLPVRQSTGSATVPGLARPALRPGAPQAHSIPALEVLTNDVRCTHGSAVGQVDQESLYYLQARGLSAVQAEQLLITSFLG